MTMTYPIEGVIPHIKQELLCVSPIFTHMVLMALILFIVIITTALVLGAVHFDLPKPVKNILYKSGLVIAIVAGMLTIAGIIGANRAPHDGEHTGRYRYYCEILPEASFVEVHKYYDVVGQDGTFWILEDKGN